MIEELVDIIVEDAPSPGRMRMRPYQQQSITAIDAGWLEFQRQLLVIPTGGGKTIIFSTIAEAEAARGGRVLILAHRDELINQAIDKLEKATGLIADKEKADEWASRESKVVVGSVQTLCRQGRLSTWEAGHFSLIVVDECHRALAKSYQAIFEHFGAAKVLGVTATPDRGDRKNLGTFFQNVAFTYSLVDAVLDGWLVRPVAETIPLEIDLRGIASKRGEDGMDFDKSELEERIAPVLHEVAREIKTYAGHLHTIVFTPGVETARLCAEALRKEGLAADFISGACQDRAEKRERFTRGETTHMCNAMLWTEGFDLDTIGCVVPLRPTKSRGLFQQMVGRGTRPLTGLVDRLATSPERVAAIKASDKPRLLILDFLWQTEEHGLVHPVHLIAKNEAQAAEMQKKVKAGLQLDLLDAQADAQATLLERLEEEVRKHKNKKRKTVDPLSFAVSVKDDDLAEYEPETERDMRPPTKAQLDYLAEKGISTDGVKYFGHASKLIGKLTLRADMGLCTVFQMNFLKRMGEDALARFGVDDVAMVKADRAGVIIGRRIAGWKGARRG